MRRMERCWAWICSRLPWYLPVLVLLLGCDDGGGNPSSPSGAAGAHPKHTTSGSGTIGGGRSDNGVNLPPPSGTSETEVDAGPCKHGGEQCATFSECCSGTCMGDKCTACA